jgi:hypothetical protein
MRKSSLVLCILLLFSFSTSGCFSSTDDYYYSASDPEDNSNSIETSDVLFTLTLDDDGGADMDISDLVIIIEKSGSQTCATSGTEGSCLVVQSGSDDSLWEIGEALNITENGVDICSQHCILAFTVDGPDGAKVMGPTILNIT